MRSRMVMLAEKVDSGATRLALLLAFLIVYSMSATSALVYVSVVQAREARRVERVGVNLSGGCAMRLQYDDGETVSFKLSDLPRGRVDEVGMFLSAVCGEVRAAEVRKARERRREEYDRLRKEFDRQLNEKPPDGDLLENVGMDIDYDPDIKFPVVRLGYAGCGYRRGADGENGK